MSTEARIDWCPEDQARRATGERARRGTLKGYGTIRAQ